MKALHINLNTCLMRPLAAAFVAVLVLSGCATRDKDGIGKDDAFMQHWQNQSVDRQGFSPALEDLAPEPRVLMKQQSVNLHGTPRALPDQPITLKLQNAAVESVLRAMASAANVSLMMSSGVSDKISLNVKNARWSDVFQSILRSNGLDYRWQGKILQVMTAADKQKEVSLLTLNNQLSEQYQTAAHSGDMMVQVVNVRYSDAASLKNSLTRFVSRNKDAVIEIDQHNNALVIQGTPTEQARILALIDSLDRPRPQVQLKAYIVETTKEKARELGMQWGGRFEHQKLIGGSGSTPLKKGGDGSTNTISGFPLGLGYGSIVNSSGAGTLGLAFGKTSVLEAQLNLMESEGVLNILSSPSITTLDNKMAYTENGEKVPYVSKDDDGDTQAQGSDQEGRSGCQPQRAGQSLHRQEADGNHCAREKRRDDRHLRSYEGKGHESGSRRSRHARSAGRQVCLRQYEPQCLDGRGADLHHPDHSADARRIRPPFRSAASVSGRAYARQPLSRES